MAGEKKKRRGRRAYLDDYQLMADGTYRYTGKVYVYSGARPWGKELTRLWLCAGAAALCAAAGGVIPASGMSNTFYVVLPWLLAFLGAVSQIWALCRMTRRDAQLKQYVYKATITALPVRTVFTAVCAAAAALGQGVRLVLAGAGITAADVLFLLLMVLAACLSVLTRLLTKSLPFREKDA